MTNYVKFLGLALIASLGLSGCGCNKGCNGDAAPVIHSTPAPEKKSSFKYGEFRSPSDTPAAVAPVLAEAVDVPTSNFAVAPVVEQAQNASVRSNDLIEEAPIAAVVSLPALERTEVAPAAPAAPDLQYVLEQWQKLPDSAKTDIITIIKTTK